MTLMEVTVNSIAAGHPGLQARTRFGSRRTCPAADSLLCLRAQFDSRLGAPELSLNEGWKGFLNERGVSGVVMSQ